MTELKLGNEFGAPAEGDWLQAVETALRGKSIDSLISTELAGFDRQPLYTEANSQTAADQAGLPGFAPFTRGAAPLNNKFLPWHIAQRIIIGRKGADNTAILTDLAGGVSALVLDFSAQDLDTKGLDALLADVMLDIAPLSLASANADTARAVLELLDKRGIGDVPLYLNLSADDAASLVDLTTERPSARLMTANGAAFHAQGAGVPQELGWILAELTEGLRALEAAGMDAAEALSKITMTISADVDFFATLAKIRAARVLFANIAEAVDAPDTPPQIHAETSLRAFSDVDPWVNILRATSAAMGAGIAGVDMLTVAPCSATSASDNALTRRIARNTQVILQEESHIGHVTDAAGGSWYVESLTQQFVESAWVEFQKIESAGGLSAAGDTINAALAVARAAFDAAVDKRAMPLVGVSEFPNLEEAPLATGGDNGYRLSAAYEQLRHAAQKAKPKVFLANIGEMASFTPRANFAANIYAAGGLHSVSGDGGTDAQAIAEAFKKSNSKIAVICAGDDDYEGHAAE
ncbi:MAG: methylmalonyl-CoA mutase family protein, partial [Parvibaculales bacterium]